MLVTRIRPDNEGRPTEALVVSLREETGTTTRHNGRTQHEATLTHRVFIARFNGGVCLAKFE